MSKYMVQRSPKPLRCDYKMKRSSETFNLHICHSDMRDDLPR